MSHVSITVILANTLNHEDADDPVKKKDGAPIKDQDTVLPVSASGLSEEAVHGVVNSMPPLEVYRRSVGVADIHPLDAKQKESKYKDFFGIADVPLPEPLDDPFELPVFEAKKTDAGQSFTVNKTWETSPVPAISNNTFLRRKISKEEQEWQPNITRIEKGEPATYLSLRQESRHENEKTNTLALPVGYTMYEYRIEKVLGSGGFGITYLARDLHLQTSVAIKEYLPHDVAVRDANSPQLWVKEEKMSEDYRLGLDRFLRESRTLASFRHPNIVRVLRFFEDNNTAYMVMEYESGESLNEWLKKRVAQNMPILTDNQLMDMFIPLLQGLAKVHESGFLHRDIKPANIYIRDNNGLVLLDFGAARRAAVSKTAGITTIVTPGYAPLEQYYAHGNQGPWSDIYAIGGVLYWLVAGRKPVEAAARVHDDPQEPAVEIGRGRYSNSFLQAIDWALKPNDADRPKSVGEFLTVFTNGEVVSPIIVQDGDTFSISISRPSWALMRRRTVAFLFRHSYAILAVGIALVLIVALSKVI